VVCSFVFSFSFFTIVFSLSLSLSLSLFFLFLPILIVMDIYTFKLIESLSFDCCNELMEMITMDKVIVE